MVTSCRGLSSPRGHLTHALPHFFVVSFSIPAVFWVDPTVLGRPALLLLLLWFLYELQPVPSYCSLFLCLLCQPNRILLQSIGCAETPHSTTTYNTSGPLLRIPRSVSVQRSRKRVQLNLSVTLRPLPCHRLCYRASTRFEHPPVCGKTGTKLSFAFASPALLCLRFW